MVGVVIVGFLATLHPFLEKSKGSLEHLHFIITLRNCSRDIYWVCSLCLDKQVRYWRNDCGLVWGRTVLVHNGLRNAGWETIKDWDYSLSYNSHQKIQTPKVPSRLTLGSWGSCGMEDGGNWGFIEKHNWGVDKLPGTVKGVCYASLVTWIQSWKETQFHKSASDLSWLHACIHENN